MQFHVHIITWLEYVFLYSSFTSYCHGHTATRRGSFSTSADGRELAQVFFWGMVFFPLLFIGKLFIYTFCDIFDAIEEIVQVLCVLECVLPHMFM